MVLGGWSEQEATAQTGGMDFHPDRGRWRLVPVSEDLFGLFYFLLRAGEVKFQFPGSARDVNLDGGQTTALHSQVELFVSLAYSVALKTCHGGALAGGGLKARAGRANREGMLLSAASTSVV